MSVDVKKKKNFEHIKSRLRNWYCDETKTASSFLEGSFLKKMWNSLLKSVNKAHKEYNDLIFDGGKIVGPPLFCRNCKYGEYSKADKTRDFGFIMETILLPLALEFYLRSRVSDVVDAAASQPVELNSGDPDRVNNAYIAIAGEDKNMQKTFKGYIDSYSRELLQTV